MAFGFSSQSKVVLIGFISLGLALFGSMFFKHKESDAPKVTEVAPQQKTTVRLFIAQYSRELSIGEELKREDLIFSEKEIEKSDIDKFLTKDMLMKPHFWPVYMVTPSTIGLNVELKHVAGKDSDFMINRTLDEKKLQLFSFELNKPVDFIKDTRNYDSINITAVSQLKTGDFVNVLLKSGSIRLNQKDGETLPSADALVYAAEVMAVRHVGEDERGPQILLGVKKDDYRKLVENVQNGLYLEKCIYDVENKGFINCSEPKEIIKKERKPIPSKKTIELRG